MEGDAIQFRHDVRVVVQRSLDLVDELRVDRLLVHYTMGVALLRRYERSVIIDLDDGIAEIGPAAGEGLESTERCTMSSARELVMVEVSKKLQRLLHAYLQLPPVT